MFVGILFDSLHFSALNVGVYFFIIVSCFAVTFTYHKLYSFVGVTLIHDKNVLWLV